jgi:hypothetical protein
MYTVNTQYRLRDLGFSNALAIDELPRHRWYFVKEGFSPKLVEQAIAIDDVHRGDILLDPFSGSGTVPLTGALCGLQTRGFEVNPFLRFLSTAKLRQVSPGLFCAASRIVLHSLKKSVPSPLEGFSTFTKGNRWNRWLFPRNILRSFEAGCQSLGKVHVELRDLLHLALLGAAMDCCNATRDGKCLRYKKDWRNKQANVSQFQRQFEKRSEIIAADLLEAPLSRVCASVAEGDARKMVVAATREKFHLCVTSPPYLNSFDYSDIYRPELFLGGFVDSSKSLMKIRLKTIRSHMQASWEFPKKDQFGSLYKNCVEKIKEASEDLWDARIPTMVQAYFEDMEVILRGLRHRAHKNASMWMVVSTSAYAGIEVPVDLILAEIGQRTGWFLREVGVLRYLRSSSQHVKHVDDLAKKAVPLRESVVIFDASRQ